jgi:hypothetical protein
VKVLIPVMNNNDEDTLLFLCQNSTYYYSLKRSVGTPLLCRYWYQYKYLSPCCTVERRGNCNTTRILWPLCYITRKNVISPSAISALLSTNEISPECITFSLYHHNFFPVICYFTVDITYFTKIDNDVIFLSGFFLS